MTKEEAYASINKFLPESLKIQFKEIKKQFDAANPVVPPAPPAATTPDPTKLGEVTLEDGTVIKHDTPTLAVGSKLVSISEAGEVPTPPGTYILKDGSTIVVDETSTVTELKPKEVAPESKPEDEIMNQIKNLVIRHTALEAENTSYKTQLESYKTELASLNSQFGKFLEVFGAVMQTPSGDPIETPKNVNHYANNRADKLTFITKKNK